MKKDVFLPDVLEKNNYTLTKEDLRDIDIQSVYTHDGVPVPRVSHILDRCLSKPGLINWASKVGWKMKKIQETSLTIGSIVHSMIEYHLIHNRDKEVNMYDYDLDDYGREAVFTSYQNYKIWRNHLESTGNTINAIIGVEVPLTCEWYGGTCDCIMTINNANYVIDFKTSKQISLEYPLQGCAYAWLINNGYCDICSHVEGVGILRFDKSNVGDFEEYFLNFHIPYQYNYLCKYTATFWSLVNSYYYILYSETAFNETHNSDSCDIESIAKELDTCREQDLLETF